MSYFWIIIVPKTQAKQFQDEYYESWWREYWISINNYWKESDFQKIPQVYENFKKYEFFETNYLDGWEGIVTQILNQKIKKLKKKWWDDRKIQDFREEYMRKVRLQPNYQQKLTYLEHIKKLSQKYDIIFWYYWAWREWNGFRRFKTISRDTLSFEEWVLYHYNVEHEAMQQ